MKKILAFLLSVIMVISMGVFSFSAQEAEKETGINTGVTSDEASKDEDLTEDATSDEEALKQLVWEYMLRQMGGVNRFEGTKYYDTVEFSLDAVYEHKGESAEGYVVFDLNFPKKDSEMGDVSVKISDSIYTNEVDYYRVSCYLGLGYYVVIPEAHEVIILEDAVKADLDGLKDWCAEEGIARKIGDADADGEITVKDATYIQKSVAGFEGYADKDIYAMYCSSYSDFDGNYKVNVKDATNIQKYLADLTFTYWGNEGAVSTVIPDDAEKLDCEIKSQNTYMEKNIVELVTNTEEYFEIFGKESDIYNEEYFESKNLVFVNKVFGSGSIGYEANALYKQGDTLYADCTIIDVKPGCPVTCDMAYRGRFFEVSKDLTEGTEKVLLYEDVLFDNDFPMF